MTCCLKPISTVLFNHVILQAQLTDEQKAKFKKAYDTCVEKSHVDTALIANMRSKKEFPQDAKLEGYVDCMFKALTFMTPDGKIQVSTYLFFK